MLIPRAAASRSQSTGNRKRSSTVDIGRDQESDNRDRVDCRSDKDAIVFLPPINDQASRPAPVFRPISV
jgi:hypothetical protein